MSLIKMAWRYTTPTCVKPSNVASLLTEVSNRFYNTLSSAHMMGSEKMRWTRLVMSASTTHSSRHTSRRNSLIAVKKLPIENYNPQTFHAFNLSGRYERDFGRLRTNHKVFKVLSPRFDIHYHRDSKQAA